MKRWWFIILSLLLLLTACGKEDPLVKTPHGLEIEYGDSGVEAVQGTYSWSWTDGGVENDAADPFTYLSEIPFVNETKDKKMKLLFEKEPDRVEVFCWSSADSYREKTPVEMSKLRLILPKDGASYLYEVHGFWEAETNPVCSGNCYYYFRYLPEDATGEQDQEMSLYQLVQMEASDLFGVEFFNNLDQERKTCVSTADREAILDYLKTYLATNFEKIDHPQEDADYVLRMAVTQGSQVTLSYGGEGQNTWIMLDGVPYRAEVMDLYTLWESLEAEAVSEAAAEEQAYLAVSETKPLEGAEGTVAMGYVQSLDETSAIIRSVAWIEDENEPNGYRLEEGDLATLTLSGDCTFWVLDPLTAVWGQVAQEQLPAYIQGAEHDILFCFHEQNGQVLAIYEQYVP